MKVFQLYKQSQKRFLRLSPIPKKKPILAPNRHNRQNPLNIRSKGGGYCKVRWGIGWFEEANSIKSELNFVQKCNNIIMWFRWKAAQSLILTISGHSGLFLTKNCNFSPLNGIYDRYKKFLEPNWTKTCPILYHSHVILKEIISILNHDYFWPLWAIIDQGLSRFYIFEWPFLPLIDI